MNGLFGDLFDLNGDGKLDGSEQAADLGFFAFLMEEEEKRTREDCYEFDEDDEDDEDDEC